jgi:hypothetical protein
LSYLANKQKKQTIRGENGTYLVVAEIIIVAKSISRGASKFRFQLSDSCVLPVAPQA